MEIESTVDSQLPVVPTAPMELLLSGTATEKSDTRESSYVENDTEYGPHTIEMDGKNLYKLSTTENDEITLSLMPMSGPSRRRKRPHKLLMKTERKLSIGRRRFGRKPRKNVGALLTVGPAGVEALVVARVGTVVASNSWG